MTTIDDGLLPAPDTYDHRGHHMGTCSIGHHHSYDITGYFLDVADDNDNTVHKYGTYSCSGTDAEDAMRSNINGWQGGHPVDTMITSANRQTCTAVMTRKRSKKPGKQYIVILTARLAGDCLRRAETTRE